MRQYLKELIRRPFEALLRLYLTSLPERPFEFDEVRRILVFAYHGLGNFIMYTPALRLLRERYPNARIDLQVGNNTGCEEVLAGAGVFDNVCNLPYSAGLRAWIQRAREIRKISYDVTVNEFHSHSWRLALLVAASGARMRVGHSTSDGWSQRFSRYSFVFNVPVRMKEDEHETDRYLDLVETLGVHRPSRPLVKPFFHLTVEDRRFADEFL
ncbi:MAG TPA: hypothetical protein VFV34_14510, partial [Blastocatellia bacterium]|nr:hypothetical protein [Blastocatellia bacterium]